MTGHQRRKSFVARGAAFLWRHARSATIEAMWSLPFLHSVRDTYYTPFQIPMETWFLQRVVGINRRARWPVHYRSTVNLPEKIEVGVYSFPGIQPGCYIQAMGKITIGDYCFFGPNVGILAGNHDSYNLTQYIHSEIRIGSYCWVGMGATILPGVVLGEFTTVGAGAVVTKSFEEGYCVIAGNPAVVVKRLDPTKCTRYQVQPEYVGYTRRQRPAAEVRTSTAAENDDAHAAPTVQPADKPSSDTRQPRRSSRGG